MTSHWVLLETVTQLQSAVMSSILLAIQESIDPEDTQVSVIRQK